MPDLPITPADYLVKWRARYKDNDTFDIDEADLRDNALDQTKTFVAKSELTANSIRGNTQLLDNLSELLTVDEMVLVIGQAAIVANATDSAGAAAGVEAGRANFRLIKNSTGPLLAYINIKPNTVTRTKASWVRTDGTDAEKKATYPLYEREDHTYAAGDVFQYTYPSGSTLLHEVKNPPPRTYLNPLPTGVSDANYTIFAPLPAPVTASYSDEQAALAAYNSGYFVYAGALAGYYTKAQADARFAAIGGDGGAAYTLPAGTATDRGGFRIGSGFTITEGDKINITDLVELVGQFAGTGEQKCTLSIYSDSAGNYSLFSNNGITSVSYKKNGNAANLPITVAAGNTIEITGTGTGTVRLRKS